MNAVTTALVSIWEDEHGFMHAEFHERFNISKEDAQEYLQTALKISDGKPKYLVFDVSRVEHFDPSAFKEVTEPITEHLTKATAVVVSMKSPLVAVGVNFFLKLQREPFPMKIFSDKEEAIKWLLSLKEKEAKP